MIRVRKGTSADYPLAMVAARKFFDEAPAGYRALPLSEGRLTQTLDGMVAQGLFLIAQHGEQVIGYAGARCGPLFYTEELVACELFWWVEPAYRGRAGIALFNALIEASRQAGASYFAPLTLEGRNASELAAFYRRRGFELVERIYIGRI